MPEGAPKDLSDCRQFFLEPDNPKQRMYEALRAYFVDGRPSREVARSFGYTPGSFQVLCYHFRRDSDPVFFTSTRPGPRSQPKKSAARELIIELRKQNHSVYEISEALKQQNCPLSPTAVREVLREEGFAALPRRLDSERPDRPRPTIEPIADVRNLSLAPRTFTTRCGGLFLFVPDLVRLKLDQLAQNTHMPGSKMIPAEQALRSCLALKLWSIERHSHVMALVADEGLALFAGLNAFPKKSYLSEYSSRVSHTKTTQMLAAWHEQVNPDTLFDGESFNLDFHSVPYYGEHPVIERHYVSARSRRQPSILVFLAQDAAGRAFCYSNADLRKGDEANEIFNFISFWKRTHGQQPRHLVFDSRLTTYANLARLDKMGISFITLRRRSPALLKEMALLPRSAWRTIELDVPTRKFRFPRVYEQKVSLAGCSFRQLFIQDLGHDEPTILLTNQRPLSAKKLITRYAQRMLIENALSDAVRFFHIDASTTDGLFKSSDGGADWTRLSGELIGCVALSVDPQDTNIVYAASLGGLFKTVNAGANWMRTSLVSPAENLVIDPHSPATIYVATPIGVLKSTDRGDSWMANPGSPGPVRGLAVDPQTPATLYAGALTGGVFKSTDSGMSWMALGLDSNPVFALVVDVQDSSTIYAATETGPFKSLDGGKTWFSINQGLYAKTTAIAGDLALCKIYVGTRDGAFETDIGPVLTIHSDLCVQGEWTLVVSHAAGNAAIRLLGVSSDSVWEIPQWGTTNDAGMFSTKGTFPLYTDGRHQLSVAVGGVLSNLISFVVSNCH